MNRAVKQLLRLMLFTGSTNFLFFLVASASCLYCCCAVRCAIFHCWLSENSSIPSGCWCWCGTRCLHRLRKLLRWSWRVFLYCLTNLCPLICCCYIAVFVVVGAIWHLFVVVDSCLLVVAPR